MTVTAILQVKHKRPARQESTSDGSSSESTNPSLVRGDSDASFLRRPKPTRKRHMHVQATEKGWDGWRKNVKVLSEFSLKGNMIVAIFVPYQRGVCLIKFFLPLASRFFYVLHPEDAMVRKKLYHSILAGNANNMNPVLWYLLAPSKSHRPPNQYVPRREIARKLRIPFNPTPNYPGPPPERVADGSNLTSASAR